MSAVLLAALLVLAPSARAVWLGRLDPQQLMGSWYVLAVASGEKDFALEKATKSIEGVEVMLTSQNTLKMRASRHRMERCHLQAVELQRQNSGWVFGNPSLGVLEYRVLGTNFRDYAIVFTQLEAQEEAFSMVELYRAQGPLEGLQCSGEGGRLCASSFPVRGVEGFRVMVPDYSASVVYLRLGRAGRTTRTLLLVSRQPTCSFLSMKKFVDACEALGLASRVAVLPKDGRNLENSPEALVEFTEFAEAQSLNLEIFRPLQSGEKPTGLLLAGARAGPSAEPQLMRTGRSDGGFVLAGVT
ncbi:hypothetical protein G4228_007590 [Cervus hanglu yarkandensis]|nr:hypothetical protein G4228_007590 [Cervus hanglu yarkandensis]